jgi:hypothetical protein
MAMMPVRNWERLWVGAWEIWDIAEPEWRRKSCCGKTLAFSLAVLDVNASPLMREMTDHLVS